MSLSFSRPLLFAFALWGSASSWNLRQEYCSPLGCCANFTFRGRLVPTSHLLLFFSFRVALDSEQCKTVGFIHIVNFSCRQYFFVEYIVALLQRLFSAVIDRPSGDNRCHVCALFQDLSCSFCNFKVLEVSPFGFALSTFVSTAPGVSFRGASL